MWKKIKKLISVIHVPIFLGFIFVIMVMTYEGAVQKAVEDTKFTFGSYNNLSDKFEKLLQEHIFEKYSFINLNGYISRVLGINSLNNVQKLRDGYLAHFGNKVDVKPLGKNLIDLNNFLNERNIKFIYVLIPSKTSFWDVRFAPGYKSNARENISNMTKVLESANLNVLDMNVWFEKNGWKMKDTFFKTDNHWLPQAGLAAARYTMELLEHEGLAIYRREWMEDANYNITELRNAYLGAWGRRTGKYYGGLDDISIYCPKFAVNYTYATLKAGSTEWIYRNNILDMSHINEENYFIKDLYNAYMYSPNYSLRITTNTEGVNNKRILIMGDSFRIPFEYFLTTQFQEIYDIDLRRYSDGTFVQYVEETGPDIIIMCTNENGFLEKRLYEFGIKGYLSASAEPLGIIQELGDIGLRAEENNNNKFKVVVSNLEPNQTYTLTVDNMALSGVKDAFVQMTLQNLSTNKYIYNRFFEANSNKKQKWIFTTPDKTGENYAIYLYAGAKGHTANISVKADGIRLQKGIL